MVWFTHTFEHPSLLSWDNLKREQNVNYFLNRHPFKNVEATPNGLIPEHPLQK
jgi:hypothetical protein